MLMYKSLKKSYHCYNVSNIQCQHNCKNLSVCYNNKKRHPHSFDYSEKTVQWIFKTIDLFENARKNAAR